MKIAALTVTSNTRESMIGAALKSADPFVDHFLILHLLDGDDNTMGVAKAAVGADRISVLDFSLEGGMSTWRNMLLAWAANEGYDWAMILDTDERILPNGVDIRAALESATEPILDVMQDNGVMSKGRFFRLPAEHRFSGTVHEDIGASPVVVMDQVRFHELPKTEAQKRARLEHDVAGLREQIEADPDNFRWHYYLGASLAAQGEHDEAVHSYYSAMEFCDDFTLRAWVWYQIALSAHVAYGADHFLVRNQLSNAIQLAPALAEPFWAMSVIKLSLHDYHGAISWAYLAITNGNTAYGRRLFRAGLSDPRALWEGPFEVLARAYDALGMDVEANGAWMDYERALEQKINFLTRGER